MKRMRVPAFVPMLARPAVPLDEDPSGLLTDHFQRVWTEQMHDLPFVNPALQVEAVGFRRYDGDWLGALITPWFINLFLVPGGGQLWQDLPSGEQRSIAFPVGTLDFVADNAPKEGVRLSAYQYCPLIHPVQHIADQATARDAANAALGALLKPPSGDEATSASEDGKETLPSPSRRAFFRGRSR